MSLQQGCIKCQKGSFWAPSLKKSHFLFFGPPRASLSKRVFFGPPHAKNSFFGGPTCQKGYFLAPLWQKFHFWGPLYPILPIKIHKEPSIYSTATSQGYINFKNLDPPPILRFKVYIPLLLAVVQNV